MRKGICNVDGVTSKNSTKIFYYNSFINESDVENFDELVQKGIIKEIVEPETEVVPEVKTDKTPDAKTEVVPEVKPNKKG
jgi:mannose/fructose/N-acetylgalactosamine-specific phosphotransferase system component IIB